MSDIKIHLLGYFLMGLSFLGAIYWVYSLFKERQITRDTNTENRVGYIPDIKTGEILVIEQSETSNEHLNILSISRFLFPLILVLVLLQAFYGIKATPRFDMQTILLSSFLLISSIWFWVDALFLTPRYYKLKFIVNDDIHYVFNIYGIILNDAMNATITKRKKLKLLKGYIGKSMISIAISQIRNSTAKNYTPDGAILVIIRATDYKIISAFTDLFHQYAKHTTYSLDSRRGVE